MLPCDVCPENATDQLTNASLLTLFYGLHTSDIITSSEIFLQIRTHC